MADATTPADPDASFKDAAEDLVRKFREAVAGCLDDDGDVIDYQKYDETRGYFEQDALELLISFCEP